ncbi:MAG TPA: helix-turn-helix domain-containing protein [Acidimicrobiia bacterium]|nr:helix-turn-helix domain-containing protein [Acidimicrobiia bacterium]
MTADAGTAVAPSDAAAAPQRARILETALRLMGEQGAQNTSMRQLAAACGLNVATLYHYFPSKAAILDAVIADKRYVEQLRESPAPINDTLAPRERLADLMRLLFEGTLAEEATLRLVIGESLRGEQVALEAVASLSAAIEDTMRVWLGAHFAEITTDHGVVSRLLRDQLLSFCVEALATPDGHVAARLRERAADIAALVVPD